ncbi:Calx-beta domain-containing protein [Chitinimonas lacunae]|uniref:Calx-beta domain-containing protein n=1 Tax=Chitinimonas lacunae TaxID=1963018 RepID=A0ABV8MQ08_9NEIS
MKQRDLLPFVRKPFVLALACALSAPALAQVDLWQVDRQAFAADRPGIHALRFDAGSAFNQPFGTEFRIELPGRAPVTAVYERAELHPNGDRTWIGHLPAFGSEYRVLITVGRGGAFGQLLTPEGDFQVESQVGAAGPMLVDLKAAGIVQSPGYHQDDLVPHEHLLSEPMQPTGQRFAATEHEIDLMVLYSPGLASAYSKDGVETFLNSLVAMSNQAYRDSQVPIKLRLVHSRKVELADGESGGSNNAVLGQLTNGEGVFKDVAGWRKQYGADLVTMVRGYKSGVGSCGVAWVGGSGGKPISRYAGSGFSVVNVGNDNGSSCSTYTFTHELGHNMGSAHDRANAGAQGAFSYSYGYGISGEFGTIMSYLRPRIGRFSNPNQTCKDKVCGISEKDEKNGANNSLSLTNTAPYVAAFMPSADGGSSASLAFLAEQASVREDGAKVTLQVGRSGGKSGAASVKWRLLAGSAKAGEDYSEASGTLNWADGDEAPKAIEVAIKDDKTVESSETFQVELFDASGAKLGERVRSTVTIADDDKVVANGNLSFSIGSLDAKEGDGTLRLTVERVGGSTGVASVRVKSRDDSARAGEDYMAIDSQLEWKDGESTAKTVELKLIDDKSVENSERLFVELSEAKGAVLGKTSSVSVNLADNDSTTPSACSQALCFDGLKSTYVGGSDRFDLAFALNWDELARANASSVDLWVGMLLPDNSFMFLRTFGGFPAFSAQPGPFRTSLGRAQNRVEVFKGLDLTGIKGQFTFYGLLMKAGADLSGFPVGSLPPLLNQTVTVR